MKASLFVTCLVDQLFPQVGVGALKVLRRLGVDVDFDPRQTCCGQPAFNSGYQDEARQVGRHFLEVYGQAETVVVPSGSCATMIKVFLPQIFSQGSEQRRIAEGIAGRTYELSDFLVSVLHRMADSVSHCVATFKSKLPKWEKGLKRESDKVRKHLKRASTKARKLQKKVRRMLKN